ncbi:cell division protein SepF [Candidatus Woesearchaeota archaeon]|nr:cell division protein SepF [Candidatus Woesearchaeota archaeon]
MGIFSKFKEKITKDADFEGEGEDYVEVGPEIQEGKSKIIVRPFVMEDFEDIKPILDSLREGYTIALVNIRPLKDKDIIELKRAINKLKKTTDAIEGDIAGFGEDYIVVSPAFAQIYRSKQTEEVRETPSAQE